MPTWKFSREIDRVGLLNALGPAHEGQSYFSSFQKDDVDIRAAILDVLDLKGEHVDPLFDETGSRLDWDGVALAFQERLAREEDERKMEEGASQERAQTQHNIKGASGASEISDEDGGERRASGEEQGGGQPAGDRREEGEREEREEGSNRTTVATEKHKRGNDENMVDRKARPTTGKRRGRVGPSCTGFHSVRGNADIYHEHGGTIITSRSGFSTVRANVAVYKGKWMYEVQLETSGILQLGFTAPNERFNSEEGIGDTTHSYAFDGKRQKKWNVKPDNYGEKWTSGDVIGCGVDFDDGSISFWRNGKLLGKAFKDIRGREDGIVYIPGISLSYGESCECNLGERPFIYPQEGYSPIHDGPSSTLCCRADFLANCLLRFSKAVELQEKSHNSPRTAAAMAATFALDAMNIGEQSEESMGVLEDKAEGSSNSRCSRGVQQGEEDPRSGSNSTDEQAFDMESLRLLQSVPELLSELAPALLGGSFDLKKRKAVEAKTAVPPSTRGIKPPMVAKEPLVIRPEAIFLTSILGRHIGPLCFSPYLVEKYILNALLELCFIESFHESGDFERLLSLLCCVLEREERESLASIVIGSLSRTIRRSAWDPNEFPESLASRYIHHARRFFKSRTFRQAWLDYLTRAGYSTWQRQLEGLFEVRQPTNDELVSILPHLKWEGDPRDDDKDIQLMLMASTESGEFSSDYGALNEMHMHLEDAHVSLLQELCDWSDYNPFDLPTSPGALRFKGCHPSVGRRHKSSEDASTAPRVWSSFATQQASLMPWTESKERHARSCFENAESILFKPSSDDAVPSGTKAALLRSLLNESLAEIGGGKSSVIVPQPLGAFLVWLEAKNAGALRDVPPPGLSPPSVLPSVFYATLRLMRRQFFDRVHLNGDGFKVPMGIFFRGIEAMASSNSSVGSSSSPTVRSAEAAPRLGGTLTYLLRERWSGQEDEFSGHIQVGEKPELPDGKFLDPTLSETIYGWNEEGLRGCWQWWLIDRLMRLYHLGVAPRVRMTFAHGNTVEQSLNSLQNIINVIREERSSGARRLLRLSIEESRRLALTAVRQQCWSVCWLMNSWKQELSLAVATCVARVLEAVSRRKEGLISFVPEYYLEATLDIMHGLRQTEARIWESEWTMGKHGLDSIISTVFTLASQHKENIVSPDGKSMLAQTIGVLLQESDALPLLAEHTDLSDTLLPAICQTLSDERNWIAIANGLGALFSNGEHAKVPSDGKLDGSNGIRARLPTQPSGTQEAPETSASHSNAHDNDNGNNNNTISHDQRPTGRVGDTPLSRQTSLLRQRTVRTTVAARDDERGALMPMQSRCEPATNRADKKESTVSYDAESARHRVRGFIFSGLETDSSLAGSFLNSMFNHINWTVTEMLSMVDELPERQDSQMRLHRERAHERRDNNIQRRASATCDLAGRLLSTVEAVAWGLPEIFIGKSIRETSVQEQRQLPYSCEEGSSGRAEQSHDVLGEPSLDAYDASVELNLTRLTEIVTFGLQQVGPGSKAATRMTTHCPGHLLMTYLGIIVGLEVAAPARSRAGRHGPPYSLVAELASHGIRPEVLARAEAHVQNTPVCCEGKSEDFVKLTPRALSALHSAREFLKEYFSAAGDVNGKSPVLSEQMNADGGTKSSVGSNGHDRRCGDAMKEEEEEVPSEFLDPIMLTLMKEPVLLPSGITVDRLTIERHLLSSATDPFSRAPLKREDLRANAELRDRIKAWKRSHC